MKDLEPSGTAFLKKRPLQFALLITVAVVVWATYGEWHGLYQMHLLGYDYGFFYYAFHTVLHHKAGAQLYNIGAQQAYLRQFHFPFIPYNQYVYPPQFAVLCSLFGVFSFQWSFKIWITISIILFALAIYWNTKMVCQFHNKMGVAVIVLAAAILTPFQLDVGVGNVNSILLAAISLTFYLLYKEKNWWAGVPLAIAIIFKVTPAAVLVYLLFRRKWKTSISTLVTILIATTVTAMRIGWAPILLYTKDFFSFGKTSMKNGPAPYNQSLIGVLGTFRQHHLLQISSHSITDLFLLYAALAAGVILIILLRPVRDWKTDYALASLTPLVFSPLVEEAHLIFAIPALFVLANRARIALQNSTFGRKLTGLFLGAIVLGSIAILSLPATFFLNFVTSHWPQLYWMHTQMFWVYMTLLIVTITFNLRTPLHLQQQKSLYSAQENAS